MATELPTASFPIQQTKHSGFDIQSLELRPPKAILTNFRKLFLMIGLGQGTCG